MDSRITKHHLFFIVIGGFTVLLTAEFAYLMGVIANEFLIFNKQNPLIAAISKEVVQISVFILSIYVFLNFFINQKELNIQNLKNLLIWLVVLFILVQVLQTLYHLYGISSFEGYMDGFQAYQDYIKANFFILIVSSVVYYLQLVFFGIIIVNHINKHD